MAKAFDYGKLKKVLTIHLVVQILLVILLAVVAFYFQQGLFAQGRSFRFWHSIVISFVIQLLLFYPMKKYAGADAEREIEASQPNLTEEQLKSIRHRRLYSDFMKGAGFIFFFTFIARAPKDLFILATIFFTFIFSILSYFQCFNFIAKRRIQEQK